MDKQKFEEVDLRLKVEKRMSLSEDDLDFREEAREAFEYKRTKAFVARNAIEVKTKINSKRSRCKLVLEEN